MAITTLAKVKIELNITDDSKNARIEQLIPLVEKQYLFIRNKPFELDTSGEEVVTIYPIASDTVAAEMIRFRLWKDSQGISNPAITSESLGDYSVSYDMSKSKYGYPHEIESLIKKYVSYV